MKQITILNYYNENLKNTIEENEKKFFSKRMTARNVKYKPGNRIGKLLIVDYLGCQRGRKDASLLVLCDCGSLTEMHVNTIYALNKAGKEVSCCRCRGEKRKISSYQEKIKRKLDILGIQYVQEYEAFDCKNPETNLALRFDFYIPDFSTMIEVQGEQHYYNVAYKNSQYSAVLRDAIKQDFCINNNLNLLYWNTIISPEPSENRISKYLDTEKRGKIFRL